MLADNSINIWVDQCENLLICFFTRYPVGKMLTFLILVFGNSLYNNYNMLKPVFAKHPCKYIQSNCDFANTEALDLNF